MLEGDTSSISVVFMERLHVLSSHGNNPADGWDHQLLDAQAVAGHKAKFPGALPLEAAMCLAGRRGRWHRQGNSQARQSVRVWAGVCMGGSVCGWVCATRTQLEMQVAPPGTMRTQRASRPTPLMQNPEKAASSCNTTCGQPRLHVPTASVKLCASTCVSATGSDKLLAYHGSACKAHVILWWVTRSRRAAVSDRFLDWSVQLVC